VELQMDLQLHQLQLGLKLKPITHAKAPKIVTGNMYSKSFGQGLTIVNCPIPLANLARNTGSVKSGF
jgi:hypothetical protein